MPARVTVAFGKRCTFRATFADESDAPADPTTVRWLVRDPAGVETTVADGDEGTEHPELGVYLYRLTPSAPGDWVVRVEGLGDVEDAADFPVHVPRSLIQTASVAP